MNADKLTPDQHERIADFLLEYKDLCEKYKIQIGACGCCESPWLWVVKNPDETLYEHIKHLADEIL